MLAWKVFDINRSNAPMFLFHGIDKSRVVPVGQWVNATKRMVKDGSSNHTYLSGFHAFPTLEDVIQWLKWVNYTDKRVVCAVDILFIRLKEHARGNVLLADKLCIPHLAWKGRFPLADTHSRMKKLMHLQGTSMPLKELLK